MEAHAATANRPPRTFKTVLIRLALAVVVVAAAGGIYWAVSCPCGGVPGFVLLGDEQREPVKDWSFANNVHLCQVQITAGWLPHSVNLNCMATPNGELFLSCSVGTRKYWCQRVGPDHPGRLRLNGKVYPVVLNRVTDPATLDIAWAARVRKLQDPEVQALQPPGSTTPPLDAKRPDTWWSFQVRSTPST